VFAFWAKGAISDMVKKERGLGSRGRWYDAPSLRGHNDPARDQRAYSDPIRPLIPTQVGHPFRRNAATDSDVKPATISSLLGIGGRHPSE